MDLLADLTDAQREAVTHTTGPLLVLAGAGSGKTRVITRRVARLLSLGIPSDQILALTFTNKAAGEMRERIEALAPQIAGLGRHVSWLLRTDAAEVLALGRNRHRLLDLRPGRPAARRQERDGCDRLGRGRLDARASRIRDQSRQERTGQPGGHEAPRATTSKEGCWPRSTSSTKLGCKMTSAVDFDDLLVHMVAILKEHKDVRAELDRRFKYVLVDEYQDTNLAQYAIVRALSVEHPNLCVTGDPDQSIYGWRGANLSNILEFEHDFPGCRVVTLERNYRSTKNIISVADHLIRFNRNRKPKSLTTENPVGRPGRAHDLSARKRRGRGHRRQDRRPGAGGRVRVRRHRRLLPRDGAHSSVRAGLPRRPRSPIRSSAAWRSTNGRRSRTSSPT